jgi:hypothetical protein
MVAKTTSVRRLSLDDIGGSPPASTTVSLNVHWYDEKTEEVCEFEGCGSVILLGERQVKEMYV